MEALLQKNEGFLKAEAVGPLSTAGNLQVECVDTDKPHWFSPLTEPSAHLPEALELPLLDAQQLAGLPADDGGVPRSVVQDGLPERRPDAQGADSDRILHANTDRSQVHVYEHEQKQVQSTEQSFKLGCWKL